MLKIAIIGMGGISQAHVAAWMQIPEAKIVAVCDIRPECSKIAAEIIGAAAYSDFDEMLKNEHHIDILDICLPTYLHAAFAIKAIELGIHVITEKPMSLDKSDVTTVYDAAKKHGVRVMVAQVLRFWREYRYLKEIYNDKLYGRLMSGTMTRVGSTPKWSWDHWMTDPKRSGLVPFDLHIHDLDFLVYMLGKPVKSYCFHVGDEKQDYVHAVYKYEDFFVSCEAAWYNCSYEFQSNFRFQFEYAVVEYKEGKITIYTHDGNTIKLDQKEIKLENGINLPDSNAYYNEIRYFVDCVLADEDCNIVKPEELIAVMDILQLFNQAS